MGRKTPKTETEIQRDQIKAAYKAVLDSPETNPTYRERTRQRYFALLRTWQNAER